MMLASTVVLLQPGQIFANDFRIVRNLSAGGMGSVFVVEQLSTGNQRALKLMHPQLVADPRLRERFLQEARVGSRIASDHVVQVLSAGIESNNVPWLVMELLQGEELRKRVERTGPIPWLEVCEIARQLNHALAAAHRVSIVHRDLKPDNLFLAESRVSGTPFTLKVLDFGIAKVLAEAQTTGTSGLGTPLWMAPEQAELKSQIDARTDIWAVGLIFFYGLTGKFFWASANVEAPSLHGLMRELLIEPIVPASVRAAERGQGHLLPPGFDAWFARCVDRDPARRFPGVDEAFTSLLSILTSGATQRSNVAPMQLAPTGQAGTPMHLGQSSLGAMAPPHHASSSIHQSYPAPPIPLHGYQQPLHGQPPLVDRSHPGQSGPGFTEHARPVIGAHSPPPVAARPSGSRRGLIAGLTIGAVILGGGGLAAWLATREPSEAERHRRRRRRRDDDSEDETEETSAIGNTLEADCQTLNALSRRHAEINTIDWTNDREVATGLPLLDRLVADLRAVPLSSGELKADVDALARHLDELIAAARNGLAAKQRGDDRSAQAYAFELLRADTEMKASYAKIAMLCPEEGSN